LFLGVLSLALLIQSSSTPITLTVADFVLGVQETPEDFNQKKQV